jgi:hypothetical protein
MYLYPLHEAELVVMFSHRNTILAGVALVP